MQGDGLCKGPVAAFWGKRLGWPDVWEEQCEGSCGWSRGSKGGSGRGQGRGRTGTCHIEPCGLQGGFVEWAARRGAIMTCSGAHRCPLLGRRGEDRSLGARAEEPVLVQASPGRAGRGWRQRREG